MIMNLHSRIIIDQFSFPLEKPQFRSSWWYLFHHVFYCIHQLYLSRKFLGINLDEVINCFMAENVTIVIRGTLIYTKLDHIVTRNHIDCSSSLQCKKYIGDLAFISQTYIKEK